MPLAHTLLVLKRTPDWQRTKCPLSTQVQKGDYAETCYSSCTCSTGCISYEKVLLRKLVETLDQSKTMSLSRTYRLKVAATYG